MSHIANNEAHHGAAPGFSYVITCTVHGVKRYFDGADFGQREEAEVYPSKQAAKAAARDCTYPVLLERVP